MTMCLRSAGPLVLGSLCLAGCALDSLGYEADVTQRSLKSRNAQLEDDRIEDKHPVFDPTIATTETFGRCSVQLDKSGSVTKLAVASYEGEQQALADALYPNRGDALAALQGVPDTEVIPSMETVNGHLKQFNDGLYAAIELAMQDGVPSGFRGKRQLLLDILAALEAARPVAGPNAQTVLDGAETFVGTALILAGATPALPASLLADAQTRAADYRKPSYDSQPVGFYTWSPELEAIFMQDRYLQGWDRFADLAGVAFALGRDPALLDAYQTVIALYAGLTNPYVSYTLTALVPFVPTAAALEDVTSVQTAFETQNPRHPFACTYPWVAYVPASRSKEIDYFNSLSGCDFRVFAGVSVLDLFIEGIRTNAVDLTPTADSGFYDYQTYGLETLLVPERGPESDHLLLTAAYKKKLIDTFKTILVENRETHVKQLATGTTVGMKEEPITVDLYPLLPVEPFPTFYLRTARAYRFLAAFLQATIGQDALGSLARLHEDGTHSAAALPAELTQVTNLVYGLHAVACASLGMRPESYLLADELSALDEPAALATAKQWLSAWRTDPDVLADPRVIVPIGRTETETRYWATIGVKPLAITAEFVAGYEPQVQASGVCTVNGWLPHRYDLLVEDTVEIVGSLTPPPTREELRRICDEKVTHDAIVAALQAR